MFHLQKMMVQTCSNIDKWINGENINPTKTPWKTWTPLAKRPAVAAQAALPGARRKPLQVVAVQIGGHPRIGMEDMLGKMLIWKA